MPRYNSEDSSKQLEDEDAAQERPSPDDPALSDVDKVLADSFPASDPPAQP